MANTSDSLRDVHFAYGSTSHGSHDREIRAGARHGVRERSGAWWLVPMVLVGAGLWALAARAVIGLVM